ncbi:hypothetical protein EI427_20130 [Flammeovirga pectinis]|uniref:Outer membrane protein beta-barrel domain-containing protein n=1 Tax=Flammeovirga pectinis TaxID=2494373 RepID=A0A3S9P8C7_9BACT|nr:outer membrane beta-barrel protein [Flammeovirga pectinis]AZQ64437.1 hypothetical protein EI427_20130 [Flammeovirga pectinis]
MKKLNLLFCILLFSLSSFGQGLKSIPGNFYFDIGLSTWQDDKGAELEAQSRSISIAYMYELSLSTSGQFTFNPGIGYTADNWFFDKGMTVEKNQNSASMINAGLVNPSANSIIKSKIVGSYLDIPLEFRFRSHPGRRAFRVAVGAKLSVLIDSHTKIKYENSYDDIRISKDRGDFYMNRFKGGLIGRVGYGWINFFCYYGLTETFTEGKLYEADGVTQFQGNSKPITIGITLSNF